MNEWGEWNDKKCILNIVIHPISNSSRQVCSALQALRLSSVLITMILGVQARRFASGRTRFATGSAIVRMEVTRDPTVAQVCARDPNTTQDSSTVALVEERCLVFEILERDVVGKKMKLETWKLLSAVHMHIRLMQTRGVPMRDLTKVAGSSPVLLNFFFVQPIIYCDLLTWIQLNPNL